MGEVRGKLVYNGKPVPEGSVLFAPKVDSESVEAGKPASGSPDQNGEFQLSTFRENDGALVGTHIVTYSAPPAPQTIDKEIRAKQALVYKEFGRLKLPPGYTVEVKPGRNDIVLELKK